MNIVLFLIILVILYSISTSNKKFINKEGKLDKDFITPDDEDLDMYKPVLASYRKAWSDEKNKYPLHHTNIIEDEKVDIGSFFKNNKYNDITSPQSKKILPDRCFMEDDELHCNFNDRLQNIPPTLIENKEDNLLLKNIGEDKNINTNIVSSKGLSFGKNTYNVWESKDERIINGGNYFNGVIGYSDTSNELLLNNIDINTDYAL